MSKPDLSAASPWPHRVALVLCCATFPLLWVGGLVTTTDAGMAVPDWPGTYGYNLFLYPWETWFFGPWDIFIEHGHRLFASLVGLISIVLVGIAWSTGASPSVRYGALIALWLVICQGVLGGLRVVLNEQTLALAHGCVGPLFFALTVALAVWTSDDWSATASGNDGSNVPSALAAKLARTAWLTTGLAYVQLIFGAGLRHLPADASPALFQGLVWLHLAMAAGLVVHMALVLVAVLRGFAGLGVLLWPALLLGGLMIAQLLLGSATWVLKYSWPAWVSAIASPPEFLIQAHGWWQTHVVTAHMAVGSLILVTSLRVALWASSPLAQGVAEEMAAGEATAREAAAAPMQTAVPRLEVAG